MAGGPIAGPSWQCTHTNRFGVCFPGFVCMWFVPVCPHYPQSFMCSGAGSIASQRGGGAQAFKPSSCKLQTRIQTRAPREETGEGARVRAGTRGMGSGPCRWVSGGSGICPAGWKAEAEVSSGVRGGDGERKRKIHRLPLSLPSIHFCAAYPARQAAPAARGAGEGTGRQRGAGGGSVQTISLLLVPGKDDFQKCELCV